MSFISHIHVYFLSSVISFIVLPTLSSSAKRFRDPHTEEESLQNVKGAVPGDTIQRASGTTNIWRMERAELAHQRRVLFKH